MQVDFTGDVFFWRGPSPFYFVRIPEELSAEIKHIAPQISYGWGVIPAQVQIGQTRWSTSLIPKDGRYLVPLRDKVRIAERIEDGDVVDVRLELTVGP